MNPFLLGLAHVVGTGQLRSAGPNGIYDDDDDMVYPPYPVDPYGSLLVTVKGHSGDSITNDPDGCIVTMEYSDSGQINSVFDDVAPFSFEFVHRGLHAVAVSCTSFSGVLVTETGVASVPGSAFYSDSAMGLNQVRFTFCKKLDTLQRALQALVEVFCD